MKTLIALFALITAAVSVQAQEYDDMYFRSKDRAKLNGDRVSVVKKSNQDSYDDETQSTINPTDSYSGRNVNPEYTSRNKVTSNSDEDAQYFVSGYEPTGVNQSLTPYNSNAFNTPYYGNSAFASSYYGYGSGFGYPSSSFYSPYSSFYNYSYWGGFYPSMSLGYMYGMGGWGSGFYGSMGYGSMWGSPYSMYGGYYGGGYGWDPFYSGYYGYGGYYGYPSVVVINNNNGDGRSNYVYGKRSSRSSGLSNNNINNNGVVDSRGRSGRTAVNSTAVNTGGRSSSNSSQYYQSGWRSNPDVQRNIGTTNSGGRVGSWTNSGSSWSGSNSGNSGNAWRGGNSNSGRSSWDNNSGGGFNNSGSFGGNSGGRSSGGSFGGSSSGGHSGGGGGATRGRP